MPAGTARAAVRRKAALYVTRDPIGYEQGDANLYRYCGNNPVAPTDPTGLVAVAPQNVGNVAES